MKLGVSVVRWRQVGDVMMWTLQWDGKGNTRQTALLYYCTDGGVWWGAVHGTQWVYRHSLSVLLCWTNTLCNKTCNGSVRLNTIGHDLSSMVVLCLPRSSFMAPVPDKQGVWAPERDTSRQTAERSGRGWHTWRGSKSVTWSDNTPIFFHTILDTHLSMGLEILIHSETVCARCS